jgi:hypothetical protein
MVSRPIVKFAAFNQLVNTPNQTDLTAKIRGS